MSIPIAPAVLGVTSLLEQTDTHTATWHTAVEVEKASVSVSVTKDQQDSAAPGW